MKKAAALRRRTVPAAVIEEAHKLGLYVITCDYLPDNIAISTPMNTATSAS